MSDINSNVRYEQVRIMAAHAPVTNIAVILVGFLFYFLLHHQTHEYFLLGWLVLLVAAGLGRLWLWHYLTDERPAEWLLKYTSFSGVLGVLWGSLFLFPVDHNDTFLIGALLMLYFGLVSASLPALAVYLPAYFIYTVPSTIAVILVLNSLHEAVYFIMAFATFVFYLMMGMFAVNSNKRTQEMIELKINNKSLVDELKSEVHQRDGIVETKTRELVAANQALFQSKEQLRNVINGANLGYWDWNYQTGDHEVNDRWLEILGLSPGDIKNNVSDWAERIHPDDKGRMESIVARSIKEHTSYVADFRMKHKNGHWVWIQGAGAVVEYDEASNEPVRLCGTHQDISQRKVLEQKLEYQATHDELTGLYNRVELWKKLDAEIQRSKRYGHDLSVFLIDIDFFKQVNDQYGHKIGDAVLVEFTKILVSGVRETDVTSRHGGEEFIVVLPETSLKKAEELAERLREQVAHTKIMSGENAIKITISIGISTFPHHGKNASQLLDVADKAMYEAKHSGRNCVRRGSALSVIN